MALFVLEHLALLEVWVVVVRLAGELREHLDIVQVRLEKRVFYET